MDQMHVGVHADMHARRARAATRDGAGAPRPGHGPGPAAGGAARRRRSRRAAGVEARARQRHRQLAKKNVAKKVPCTALQRTTLRLDGRRATPVSHESASGSAGLKQRAVARTGTHEAHAHTLVKLDTVLDRQGPYIGDSGGEEVVNKLLSPATNLQTKRGRVRRKTRVDHAWRPHSRAAPE
jgi:hypothetical protein